LRFAITSPPSGCEEDFHLQAVKHARHTKGKPELNAPAFMALGGRVKLEAPKGGDLPLAGGDNDDKIGTI